MPEASRTRPPMSNRQLLRQLDRRPPRTLTSHPSESRSCCIHQTRRTANSPPLATCRSSHDVGKLAASSAVLEKPGELDDHEWHVMRSHASHTAAILSRIAPFRSMAPITCCENRRGRRYGAN